MNFCDKCGRRIEEDNTIKVTIDTLMFRMFDKSYTQYYCIDCFNKFTTKIKHIYNAYKEAGFYKD